MNASGFPRAKSIGLLLDPDKASGDSLQKILKMATESHTDYILTGGSLSSNSIEILISEVKKQCSIPVVLFPGNLLQLNLKADIIMLLSLISGRNPEFLIGNHVIAAPYLKNSREKIAPVGYILINCGNRTSVEYISQTDAIPSDKIDIVVATAIAGEMLGLKIIYLEAGSGASRHVPVQVVSAVKQNISIPVIAGGGIRTKKEVEDIFGSGADMIVLGNSCEQNPDLLKEACRVRDKFRS
jgi:putative glycerol-1-phosphate prenyltransferase